MRSAVAFALAVALLVVPGGPALAHKLKVFATAVGPLVEGLVYFVGGGPVAGATVAVSTTDGRRITTLVADDHGRFSFVAQVDANLVFAVDAGDGHMAQVVVSAQAPPGATATGSAGASAAGAASGPPSLPTTALSEALPEALNEAIGTAVAKQLQPLREQLNAYEDQVRFRDIVGGLGYIIGLAGLGLWLKSRRRTGAGP